MGGIWLAALGPLARFNYGFVMDLWLASLIFCLLVLEGEGCLDWNMVSRVGVTDLICLLWLFLILLPIPRFEWGYEFFSRCFNQARLSIRMWGKAGAPWWWCYDSILLFGHSRVGIFIGEYINCHLHYDWYRVITRFLLGIVLWCLVECFVSGKKYYSLGSLHGRVLSSYIPAISEHSQKHVSRF